MWRGTRPSCPAVHGACPRLSPSARTGISVMPVPPAAAEPSRRAVTRWYGPIISAWQSGRISCAGWQSSSARKRCWTVIWRQRRRLNPNWQPWWMLEICKQFSVMRSPGFPRKQFWQLPRLRSGAAEQFCEYFSYHAEGQSLAGSCPSAFISGFVNLWQQYIHKLAVP